MNEIKNPDRQSDPIRAEVSPAQLRKLRDNNMNLAFTLDHTLADSKRHNIEKEQILAQYFHELHARSEYSSTIPCYPFSSDDLMKLSHDEVSLRRDEFDEVKSKLKREWEILYDHSWPKYETDVFSLNEKLIRKAGHDYDAHHIQPLGLGGKNEALNITPLHAREHYDRQGIHSFDGPYNKLCNLLGGEEP